MPAHRSVSASVVALSVVLTGCIPYAVASTAQPVPPGETVPVGIVYGVPGGTEFLRDDDGERADAPVFGFDAETRIGINDRSDAGIRIPSSSGIVANYKRRLTASRDRTEPALAVLGGAGFVNAFAHAWFELTLIASGRQSRFTPYGGLRVTQVAPIARGAVHDSPTAGGFVGARIGSDDLGISPEIGLYYDRSALGLRSNNHIVVLAVGLHGQRILEALGTAGNVLGR